MRAILLSCLSSSSLLFLRAVLGRAPRGLGLPLEDEGYPPFLPLLVLPPVSEGPPGPFGPARRPVGRVPPVDQFLDPGWPLPDVGRPVGGGDGPGLVGGLGRVPGD